MSFAAPGGAPEPSYETSPPADAGLPRVYPQLLRGPRYQWWRGVLSIVLAVAGLALVWVVVSVAIFAYLLLSGHRLSELAGSSLSNPSTAQLMGDPWLFLGNNLSLAALIPVAGLSVWACHGWRPGWVSSVAPRLRWIPMVVAAGVTAVVYGGYSLIDGLLNGGLGLPSGGQHVALLLTIVVLTTPFQSAGEEYLFRGVLTQSIGSWFSRPLAAFLVSGLSTAVMFAALHSIGGPQNFWLFFTRFGIGLATSYLAWRTGGLEAGIALHTVNNVFGLVPAILAGELGTALSNPPQEVLSSFLQLLSVVVVAAGILLAFRLLGVRRVHDPQKQPGGVPQAAFGWTGGGTSPGSSWPAGVPMPAPQWPPFGGAPTGTPPDLSDQSPPHQLSPHPSPPNQLPPLESGPHRPDSPGSDPSPWAPPRSG